MLLSAEVLLESFVLVAEGELVLLGSTLLVVVVVEAESVLLVSMVLSSELVLEVIALSVEAESVLLVSMVLSSLPLFEVGFVDVERDVLLESFSLVAEVVLVVVVVGGGEFVSLGSIVLSFGVVSEVFVLVIEEDSVLLESIVFSCIVLVDAGDLL